MSDRERANADVEGAMQAPAAFRRDGFLVAATTVERTLQIDVRIPSSALRIRRTGATERATFVVHAELRSTTGKRNVKALPGKDVVLDLSPERMNAIRAMRQGRGAPGLAGAVAGHVPAHCCRAGQRRVDCGEPE